jgi:hypothetical protein
MRDLTIDENLAVLLAAQFCGIDENRRNAVLKELDIFKFQISRVKIPTQKPPHVLMSLLIRRKA